MLEQRIKELESQLVTANESIVQLTKTNAELTSGLAQAELQNRRNRRNSRRDEGSLREQITSLQNRRG